MQENQYSDAAAQGREVEGSFDALAAVLDSLDVVAAVAAAAAAAVEIAYGVVAAQSWATRSSSLEGPCVSRIYCQEQVMELARLLELRCIAAGHCGIVGGCSFECLPEAGAHS